MGMAAILIDHFRNVSFPETKRRHMKFEQNCSVASEEKSFENVNLTDGRMHGWTTDRK